MKIGQKVFVILCLISVSLVAIPSYIIITAFTDGQKELVEKNLLEKNANTMDKISRLMTERIVNLKILVDPTNKILSDPSVSLGDKVNYLRSFQRETKIYATISIYDTNGIKIGDSENVGIGTNDSKEIFFSKAKQGEIYWDHIPIYQNDFQKYMIHLSSPLKDSNNEMIGVLVLNFPMEKLNALLQKEHYSDDTDIDLLTRDGILIYSNHDPQILHHSWHNSVIFNKIIQSHSHGISDVSIDPEGNREVFAATQDNSNDIYTNTGWILITGQDTDIAFSKINDLQNQFIGVSLAIFVASVVSSVFFSKMISRPIIKLVNISERIANGDFATVSESSSSDEFGDLTHSINMMSKSLEEYRKKLIDSERLSAMGQLSARIAHDIRNPISTIKNAANLIKLQNPNLDKDTLHKFSIIDSAVMRVIHQLEEVLDFVVPKQPLVHLTTTRKILQSVLSRINVPDGVKVNLPSNEIDIACDLYKMEVVFVNLILNAIQAMGNHGTVTIRVSENENSISFDIEDTGPGIPENILPKIFDPLFTTRQVGTGLGLTSCKSIVEQHGGSIDVKTEIGKGTTFTISIPKQFESLLRVESNSAVHTK